MTIFFVGRIYKCVKFVNWNRSSFCGSTCVDAVPETRFCFSCQDGWWVCRLGNLVASACLLSFLMKPALADRHVLGYGKKSFWISLSIALWSRAAIYKVFTPATDDFHNLKKQSLCRIFFINCPCFWHTLLKKGSLRKSCERNLSSVDLKSSLILQDNESDVNWQGVFVPGRWSTFSTALAYLNLAHVGHPSILGRWWTFHARLLLPGFVTVMAVTVVAVVVMVVVHSSLHVQRENEINVMVDHNSSNYFIALFHIQFHRQTHTLTHECVSHVEKW